MTENTTETQLLGPEALKDLRARVLAGEDIAPEEVGRVIATLRGERSKIGVGKASTSKTARQPMDLNALFSKPGDTK